MREKTKTILAKILPASGTIRRRMFFLLGGMSIGALLVANLIWLPSAIKEIRQAQVELRRVSVRLIRDQMQWYLEAIEKDLRDTAQHFRPSLVERDQEGLRLTAQRLLQSNPAFEEIGILDGKGKELLRLSRRTVITAQDLIDRSASSLFREGMKQDICWGAVTITETSEPRVALTVRLPGFDTPLSGLVFGVINLKSLWNLTREFKLSNEGRAYIVEEMGRLIAAADPSVVLRQLSLADRHVIQQLTDPRSSVDRSFVEGNYTNERGVPVTATGLLLSRPRWGVVIEQPRSVLFAPIRQKIWFFASLSFMGLLVSFGLAQMLSRRLTEPVVRLREGAEQVGGGNLEYKVSVETNDEIGELARQFNRMAEQLHASQQATLSALTIPVMSQLSEMQEVLDEVIAKVMTVTEAEAASIRIMDDEKREFVFSVYQGFSKAYMHERPTMVRDEAGGEKILQTLEPFISGDILTDSGANGNPLVREGFRSVVYLPLKTPKKTFGLMTLASREPGRLSSKKADIFRAIAHQISVALENADLFAARKRAEEALLNAAEQWRTTFDGISDIVCLLDREGRVLRCNKAMTNFLGKPFSKIIGRPHWEIIYGTTEPIKECPVERMRETHRRETAILPIGDRWFSIAVDPLLDEAFSLIGAVHIMSDITERKRAEKAVTRLSQENAIMAEIGRIISSTLNIAEVYELFAEEVRELIRIDRMTLSLINADGHSATIAYVWGPKVQSRNQGDVFPLKGTLVEMALTKRSGILILMKNEEALARSYPTLINTFRTGFRSLMSVPLISKDQVTGVLILHSFREDAYTDPDLKMAERVGNQIAGAVASSQLFIERRRAEESLRQSEEKYRTILENMEEGYFEIDLAGNFAFVNDAECRNLGHPRQELIGMNNRQFTDQTTSRKLYQTFNEVYRTGEPAELFDVEMIRKDGAKAVNEISASLIRDSEGKPIGFRGVSRDVTERKRADEAVKRLSQENAIMAEIGRVISSTLNIEEVYERFAEEVRKLIPFDRIVINVIDIEKATVTNVYMAGAGIADRKVEVVYPLKGSGNAEMVRTKSSFLIQTEDFNEYKDRFPMLLSTFQSGFRSIMNIPLFSKGRIIGGLLLRSLKPYAYTDEDVRLAERVGDQIAGAIANAQLFAERKHAEEAAQRLSQENAVMAEIGRIISSTLNIEEVYAPFAEEVRKLIPFDRIGIQTVNIKDNSTILDYVSGVDVEGRRIGDIISLEGTATGECVRTRSSCLFRLESEDEVKKEYPGLLPTFKSGLRSVLVVPLISKDEVIGVFHLRSFRLSAYTESDVRLAERVGSQIAGAIANAKLYAEQKQMEDALRKSEERFRDLYDHAPLGYHEYDGKGIITNVNRTDLEMLGYTAEEMIGHPMWEFNIGQENVRKQVLAKLAGTLPPGRNLERTYRRKDGSTIPVLIEDRLILDGKGQIKGIRCTTQDITERRRAEEERLALQEQLRQSQKMEAIGKLAGGVAHDFNNLLTVIQGYSELMLHSLDQNSQLRQDVQEIINASGRASSLTRQLLAFSRKQVLQPKVLDLNVHVSDMDKMLRRMIGEDIELVTLLAKDLGRIKGDPGQIEQVLLNLAVNAKDAMLSGGKLTIETANVKLDENYARSRIGVIPGDYVMLSMSDTGVGMTPETKERIFEPFFTTKEKGKGTGLGLSTVYGIIQQSGGNIWVYSEPGLGTTFKIYLPRIEEGTESLRPAAVSTKPLQGFETVLLVEDEEMVRRLACTVLEKKGYRVLEASNGDEALDVVQGRNGNPIHLVVTDVVMPGMSGRQLADRLVSLQPELKVLYMSGYTDNAIVHHGVLDPGLAYIQKPFTPDALATKVREILDGH